MSFDDRITINTPEGLEIELNLAGLGSRIAAAVFDALFLGVLLALAAFGLFSLADRIGSPLLAIGLGWLVVTILVIGYFVAFETFNDGRTPGKTMIGIRVVGADGQPVRFGPSLVRNLLRLVDLFPAFPIIGPIAILVSDRNQRLGDLAAGTIVVRRERSGATAWTDTTEPDPSTAHWDVSGVGDADLELARRFLGRREDLVAEKRAEHAEAIAARLRQRVPGLPPEADDEWLVEQITAIKTARRR